jgi:tRNA G18 (ribose-2'-O)-methylase SpoU
MKKLKLDELNRITVEQFKQSEKNSIIIVLDNIRSLNNVGSVFRTSDAFLVESVYLCGITGTPPHREIHKTALGSENSVEWKYFQSTIDALLELKQKNYQILAVEQTDSSIFLQDFIPKPNEKYALIFGNEVDGVSDEALEVIENSLEIPQFGSKHSFNISVTVGIVLWHFALKKL